MNPFQKNKVDMSALSPEEQKAFRLYGKLPNRKDVMQNKLKERKYFDSGDYALSKAGKSSEISPTDVGREHPVPEKIPHLSQSPSAASNPHQSLGSAVAAGVSPSGLPGSGPGHHMAFTSGQSGSPVKESSFLHRGESIDDQPGPDGSDGAAERADGDADAGRTAESVSPPPKREGVPVPVRGGRGPPPPGGLR